MDRSRALLLHGDILDRLYSYYTGNSYRSYSVPFEHVWSDIRKVWTGIIDAYILEYNTSCRFLQRNKLRLKLMDPR